MATTTWKYCKNLYLTESCISLFLDVNIALLTSNDQYSFGLFLASNQTSKEARRVFYLYDHFIFKDRFNLKRFIVAIKENAKNVHSVSLDLYQKSTEKHSLEMRHIHREWSLHFTTTYGPRISDSIVRLKGAFQSLQYLELSLHSRTLPKDDKKEMKTKDFPQWPWIMKLASLRGVKFSILTPGESFISCLSVIDAQTFENATTRYSQIKEYLNKKVSEQTADN
jgi:hypothetical protein